MPEPDPRPAPGRDPAYTAGKSAARLAGLIAQRAPAFLVARELELLTRRLDALYGPDLAVECKRAIEAAERRRAEGW